MTEEEIFNKIADMISERFSIDRDKITKDLNFNHWNFRRYCHFSFTFIKVIEIAVSFVYNNDIKLKI